jgi:hypothetical protein
MAAPCFRMKNANPPICGVRKLKLVLTDLPIDPNAPHLGHITCYVCPVSGQLVTDHAHGE